MSDATSRAKGIHSPFLADQREERLSGLFDSLIEGLRRAVAISSENLVLCSEHALYKCRSVYN